MAKISSEPAAGLAPLQVESTALANLHSAAEAPADLGIVVRKAKVDPAYRENLKASIKAVGILVPLLTHRHKGKSYVTAGNQRLDILRELYPGPEASEIFVPTVDDSTINGESRELAVMHNIAMPMHPIDQFEVISGAHGAGMPLADIGARWGLTDRRVRQIMAYGGLHSDIRQAWRDGVIDAACAKAFTLGEPAEQEKVFKRGRKDGRLDARSIQSAFVGKQYETGRHLVFVGIEAYEKAGGTVKADLFGHSHTVDDTRLLHRLVIEGIEDACSELRVAGWKWAEPRPQGEWEFGRKEPKKIAKPTNEQKAALDEIRTRSPDDDFQGVETPWQRKQRIDAEIKLASYDADERAKLGCFVSIDNNGNLIVDAGRVRPEEKKAAAAKERATERKAVKAKVAAKGESSLMISNALAQRLSEQLTHAAADALLASPDVALAALIAGFASGGDVVDVRESGLVKKQAAKPEKIAAFESVFADAQSSDSNKMRIERLTQIAAAALDFQVFRADRNPLDDKGIRALCEALSPGKLGDALKKHFDAKDYFNAVSREVCLSAIKEMVAGAGGAPIGKTKADAAAVATDLAKAKGWLPVQLRTIHYRGPGAGNAKPAKGKAKRKAKR